MPRRSVPGRRIAGHIVGIALLSLAIGCGEVAPPAPPNLVVFVLDAARADHVGCYGYERDTTPNIDRLAAEGTRFDAAFAESSFTFASTAALMIGQSPAASGVLARKPIADSFELLPELARRSGYLTLAYSENPYVTETFGFEQGFERFDSVFPFRLPAPGETLRTDFDSSAGIRRMLEVVRSDPGRPFFAYLHVLRPHNPYAPPEDFAGRFGSDPERRADGSTPILLNADLGRIELSDARRANMIALYDENLAYGDALLGELLAGLSELDLVDETAVIVVSDHGEAFGEHGRMLHSTQVYDEMIRIPLVVRVPGHEARVSHGLVQLADLGQALRTVVQERSPRALVDLGGEERSRPWALSWSVPHSRKAGVRTLDRKLILDSESLSPTESYDLSSDPRERRPRSPDANHSDLLEVYREAVAAPPPAPGAEIPVDEKTQEQLRSLGYLPEAP